MLSVLSLAIAALPSHVPAQPPLWFQHPTVNQTTVCFAFAGDLWTVARAGGEATRLTSGTGQESNPYYSPDGKWVAFTGQFDGNVDVYVVSAQGGNPKRLTYHPASENVLGWTPDGKRILYSSFEASLPFIPRLFTVSIQGGPTDDLPFPTGTMGSFSPDGKQIAYVPYSQFQPAWKRYRGGETYPIWIAKLEDSSWRELPRRNSNEKEPMWIGERIYFLSDRTGRFNLYSCTPNGDGLKELAKCGDFDFSSATSGPGVIALAKPGSIQLYDIAAGKLSDIPVSVKGDFPEVRRKFVSMAPYIASGDVSPNGKRAVFEARGDIVTVPASKGDGRNLTQSSGSAERSPAWSPDGKWIAFMSDASGEYRIVLQPSDNVGESKSLEPGQAPAFYGGLVWSPDSKKLAYTDNRCMTWITDVETGKSTKVDEAPLLPVSYQIQPVWSPDSKWLAYARQVPSYLKAVFLYSLELGKATQLTDGLSDAQSPAFDRGGKYLYFLASTNAKTSTAWLDLSALESPNVTSSAYVVVLQKDEASPFAPESDEEPIAGAKKPDPKKEDFRIDLDGINSRVLSIPMPARVYGALVAGMPGTFFTADVAPVPNVAAPAGLATIRKFDLNSRQESGFAAGIQGYTVSANGQNMLLFGPGGARIVSTAAPPPPGQGALSIGSTMLRIEPREEWKQMFREVLRIQRDFFYDPGYHGVDLNALKKKYEPFLEGLADRSTLNLLFVDMLGELTVGHMYIGGGDIPGSQGPNLGFLGADFSLENGRWRFKKVYNGENWNPGLTAPLSAPGVDVKAGEYLLAINGVEIKGTDDVYSPLEDKVGKQVRLKVGPDPSGTNAREVVVVPIENETGLRVYAWIEGNRRKVEELSGGRVGYVWVPNTSVAGYSFFNRYFYAQSDKDGIVIDERNNGGGSVDDYFITMLGKPMMSWWMTRYGQPFPSPMVSVFGPKALITDQYAGSGGDYFPWAFKRSKLGPLVGKRTWGGLVGILGFPPLLDGGGVTSPNLAFFTPEGEWQIENHGVDPDIEVELDPVLWRQGRDAQLERAVAEVMKQLKDYKRPTPKIPAFKNNTKIGG